jgi:UPF0176 protein
MINSNNNEMMNISAYCFVELDNLQELRLTLKNKALSLDIKGTILLAHEGINLFLAGTRDAIAEMTTFLNTLLVLPDIEFKESISDHKPFKRLLVRIKKEIISMGVPEIKPSEFKAPYITPQELKNKLDNDPNSVVILDTRNDYEIKLGKFSNAVELPIRTFRAFPDSIQNLDPSLKDKPIVTYCTGGIRCEKAASFMISQGFKEVYQLQGGILKYFEECGESHYEGDCFVFDKRVALDANLAETSTTQCFACRMPVTLEEQQSPLYKIAEHCPACYEKASADALAPTSLAKLKRLNYKE